MMMMMCILGPEADRLYTDITDPAGECDSTSPRFICQCESATGGGK